jgi:NAD(P)-dependent dehydrogenase (short-subunit alcohol dehydrogenase family)
MENLACGASDEALELLKRAEGDLEAAEAKEKAADDALHEAKRDTTKARDEVKNAIHEIEHPRKFKVEVLYDGVKKTFEVRLEEAIKKLLEQAIRAFGQLPNPHMLSLYNKAGNELADTSTVEQAGVKPCDVLLLRPSTVKGG